MTLYKTLKTAAKGRRLTVFLVSLVFTLLLGITSAQADSSSTVRRVCSWIFLPFEKVMALKDKNRRIESRTEDLSFQVIRYGEAMGNLEYEIRVENSMVRKINSLRESIVSQFGQTALKLSEPTLDAFAQGVKVLAAKDYVRLVLRRMVWQMTLAELQIVRGRSELRVLYLERGILQTAHQGRISKEGKALLKDVYGRLPVDLVGKINEIKMLEQRIQKDLSGAEQELRLSIQRANQIRDNNPKFDSVLEEEAARAYKGSVGIFDKRENILGVLSEQALP